MFKRKNCFAAILALALVLTSFTNVFAASSSTPPAPTLSFSPMSPTNGNVTVTIYYPSTAVTKQYKLGSNGTWTKYSSPVVITSNTYVYAQYKNTSGAWSALGGYPISNIDKTPPSAPVFTVSPTAPTNQNVSVSIAFSADSVVKQYKLGDTATWTNYSAPIAVSSNTTVYAKASDSVGNWTAAASYSVSNIDKVAPAAPVLTADTVNPTNKDVTVSISYPADANVKQYKIGTSGTWLNYNAPLIISSNTVVYAKAQDPAGNWSPIVSFDVANIDKTAPADPSFTVSTTDLTNRDVTVTIGYSADSSIKQYKTGYSGIWTDYTSPLTISANETIYAKASDSVGNWTPEASYTVSNIDKSAPDSPAFTLSTTAPTNQNVTLAIDFSSDSVIKQYRIGADDAWIDYSSPLTLDSNITVYAKASDSVGNWSAEISYDITNIDKAPPAAPGITASTTEFTNQDVYLSIDYSQDSVIKQYRVGDSGVWNDYNAPVAISSNTAIYAKASDNAGNWTSETVYSVSNIDKTAPINPIISLSTTAPTNQPVTVNIIYSSDSGIRQYKIGASGIWSNYTSPVVLSSNNILYAKASDSAGNWSAETSITIENIDTAAPSSPSISASTTAPTTLPVTLSINYSADSIIRNYKLGLNGTWTNYTAPISISSNTFVYAKGADTAGNWSPEASYAVTNISSAKLVLGYTVKYYSTDVSSYNSMVANASVLNEIATATFTVDGLGTLTGTAPADQISFANNNGIKPKLMVSNSFDANIAKQLLESPENRQNLKNNLLNLLKAHSYKGVDIDIENIPAANRAHFTTFMSEIYSALKPLGYEVSVAVQAKTYDSPNASWTYAFDYKSLAMYSDYLMIMAYDEHYAGGTPGAVASIGWVTSVIDYTLSVVPKEKIVLGLAAYGYDWSSGATKSYSVNGCINLANQYGSTIYLDNTTKSKYFTYTVNGVAHTVWFEDGETISYKLDLVNSRDLKGIGIWRLGLENTDFWTSIKAKLNK